MINVLITGACGFIGHHLLEFLFFNTDWNFFIIDKLTYASKGLNRLREINLLSHPRVKLFTFDITNSIDGGLFDELKNINFIIHLAAETHVNNSIIDPDLSIHNNIISTLKLLQFARKLSFLHKFIYFSTDEVYGPALNNLSFNENNSHNPTNPYSASKSASEAICIAFKNTFNLPIIITNTVNVFGERQHMEKFIPICINNILNDTPILIHSYPNSDIPGSRFYIYVKNVAKAIHFLLINGRIGEKYNISGQIEIDNFKLSSFIANILHKPDFKFQFINFDHNRPGHDLRYDIDGSKLKNLGWSPDTDVYQDLKNTILWTVDNNQWLLS